MKVSKNQVTCARCHLVGLASSIAWTVISSALRGAASSRERRRVWNKRLAMEPDDVSSALMLCDIMNSLVFAISRRDRPARMGSCQQHRRRQDHPDPAVLFPHLCLPCLDCPRSSSVKSRRATFVPVCLTVCLDGAAVLNWVSHPVTAACAVA